MHFLNNSFDLKNLYSFSLFLLSFYLLLGSIFVPSNFFFFFQINLFNWVVFLLVLLYHTICIYIKMKCAFYGKIVKLNNNNDFFPNKYVAYLNIQIGRSKQTAERERGIAGRGWEVN